MWISQFDEVCNKSLLNLKRSPFMGHTPSTAGTFRKKFRKNSGETPETLSERFLEFLSRVRLDAPTAIIQGIWGFQSISRILSPPSTVGDASFFRNGSGEGLSELVMEFPAVLRAFPTSDFIEPAIGAYQSLGLRCGRGKKVTQKELKSDSWGHTPK